MEVTLYYFFKEKNESLEKVKMQELELKKKEMVLQEKKHDNFKSELCCTRDNDVEF